MFFDGVYSMHSTEKCHRLKFMMMNTLDLHKDKP